MVKVAHSPAGMEFRVYHSTMSHLLSLQSAMALTPEQQALKARILDHICRKEVGDLLPVERNFRAKFGSGECRRTVLLEGLSTKGKVGMGIIVTLVVLAVIGLAAMWYTRRRKRRATSIVQDARALIGRSR